jgi:hypothetical protein
MLHLGLSCPPMVHANQMWQWVHGVEDMEKSGGVEGGERCLKDEFDEWGGLGRTRTRWTLSAILSAY